MPVHARGAARTASPFRKGSCKSCREACGLHWGVRGWTKSLGVRGHSQPDALERWGDLVTHCEPVALAGVQTLHIHTRVQTDHSLIAWPVHVLEMCTPSGTNSLHAAFYTTRLWKEQRNGMEVFRELGKGGHRHLGPVERAVCWQRWAHSGKAASRAYEVKQGVGRWLVWHHATLFCF